jgi:hypothetical protein
MARMGALLARLEALPARTWLWIVAGVAVLQRALMWAFYPVVPLGDSGSYRRSAEAILNGWSNYDGTRTPGYPAFMALAGADQRVYLAQLALGLGITLLLFYIGWKISGKAWFGALIALSHTLNAGQFFFEANLMTETLTTFWLAVAWAGMAYLLAKQAQGPRDAWIALAVALVVGLATGLALLTRPLFIFLPFWSAFFLIAFYREYRPKSAPQRCRGADPSAGPGGGVGELHPRALPHLESQRDERLPHDPAHRGVFRIRARRIRWAARYLHQIP